MFGFGILVSGALLTLASIGWPVYLHFRNRKNIQIQRVPSLRLFGFSKKRTKRILFEHLLLLLSRCLMLAALAILLAKQFKTAATGNRRQEGKPAISGNCYR